MLMFYMLFIVIARNMVQCDGPDVRFLSHGAPTELIVRRTVNSISKAIKDIGLDPLRGGKQNINNTKLIPVNMTISEFYSNGLSNIVVNKAKYNLFSSILQFDIEMPFINMTLGSTSISANALKNNYTVVSSVGMEVRRIRVVGHVDFDFHMAAKFVDVKDLKIHFTLESMKSNVKLIIQGLDYSKIVNDFLSTIPEMIKDNSPLIDEFLEKFLKNYVSDLLSNAF